MHNWGNSLDNKKFHSVIILAPMVQSLLLNSIANLKPGVKVISSGLNCGLKDVKMRQNGGKAGFDRGYLFHTDFEKEFPSRISWRSILNLPLSKLYAVPFALQNRALFEGEKRAKTCRDKGRKRGGQQGRNWNKGHVRTRQKQLNECSPWDPGFTTIGGGEVGAQKVQAYPKV